MTGDLFQRHAHAQVKVVVLGDAAMEHTLGKVKFEPRCHNIELWYHYHLVALQPSRPTLPQLTPDLWGAVPCYASSTISATEL